MIATWNLCLGISNKKDTVIDHLIENKIDICALQETEIPMNYPENTLNFKNYNLELESNTVKKRVGIYVNTKINYTRRTDLETEDLHLIIIDVHLEHDLRIINIYRSFRPQGLLSPMKFFENQLKCIKKSLTRKCVLLGEFNLDASMENCTDYHNKIPLATLIDFTQNEGLTQIVNFKTWSRVINGVKKESLLDHIYTNDTTL